MPFDSLSYDAATDDLSISMTSQVTLEKLYSKYQLMRCISEQFINANFALAMDEKNLDSNFGIDLMTQMVLHKRAQVPVLVGILIKHFDHAEDPAQACADAILVMAQEDFVDWEDVSQSIVMRYNICEETRERLAILQYPLPMVEKPSEVTHNKQTGYQTIKGSLLLKNNHHEDDICLDHVNRANNISLALNADVVAFVQNKWSSLDKPKQGEDRAKYLKRVKAFETYDKTSREVLEALMAQGDRFWLTHKYDKRGRSYCQGYHVNYQGNDWNKSCIELADAEILNLE